MKKKLLNKIKTGSFIVLPIIFLIISIVIHFGRGKFYLAYVDPEYFHFFNGLNMAIFNLAVDYIHHPGTTLQVIFAISARIVNLIEPGSDIITNALNNPEQFIHSANILLNILTCATLLVVGYFTYKYTGNIFIALLLQLMPFGSYSIMIISGRLIPETVLIAPLMLLVLLFVRYLYDKNTEKNIIGYIIGFSIIGGIGMAGKFLYLPFLIVPFFILQSAKSRLKYALYTFIAIVIFAFPVFVHIGKSFDWFGSMFIYSGQWGSGEKNVFDFEELPNRINKLYNIDKSFFVISGLALVQLIVFYIFIHFKKVQNVQHYLKVLLAFLVAIAVSILIISKHFAIHYFYPTLVIKIFLIYLMTELFVSIFQSKHASKLVSVLALIVALMLVTEQLKTLRSVVQIIEDKAAIFEERAYILKQYDEVKSPLIITSHYTGSPFVESAMVGGLLMSGHLKTTFTKQLMQKYPNTYFYFDWDEEFYYWDEFLGVEEFVDPEEPLYLFIGQGLESNLDVILGRLSMGFPDYEPELILLHHFQSPDEYFYKVRFVQNILVN